jgi:hypothetical protein
MHWITILLVLRLYVFRAGVRWNCVPSYSCSKPSTQLHKMYQSRCAAKNYWRWAERLSETRRVVIPIKLEFSASVGFIHKEYCNVSSWTPSLAIWILFTLSRCFLKIFCSHLLLVHSFGPFQSDFPLQLCVHFLSPTVEWVELLFCILEPRSQICAPIPTVPTLLSFHYDVFFILVVPTASSSSNP